MKKVVTIGGGTGNFVVLKGLKQYDLDLAAIVSMTDDGGSSGVLREELGVLPPGDIRQCIVALSESDEIMQSLMSYRFTNNGLNGHCFGNLFLSALEIVAGDFVTAISLVSQVLNVKGKIIPVTTQPVWLKMELSDGTILSRERDISLYNHSLANYHGLSLYPLPIANPAALEAITGADLIVLSPGNLYTSLAPNLLVPGISDALKNSPAKKVMVINLVNRQDQTPGYTTGKYLSEISTFIGQDIFDYLIIDNCSIPRDLSTFYSDNQLEPITDDLVHDSRVTYASMLNPNLKKVDGELMSKNRIRHDSDLLARELMKIVDNL